MSTHNFLAKFYNDTLQITLHGGSIACMIDISIIRSFLCVVFKVAISVKVSASTPSPVETNGFILFIDLNKNSLIMVTYYWSTRKFKIVV